MTSFVLSLVLAAVDWNDSPAFQHFFNLDYDRAVDLLEKQAAQDNAHHANHLAYAMFYRALYRAGALDTSLVTATSSFFKKPKVPMPAADRERFHALLDGSMKLSRDRLARNPKDADALYTLGVAHIHRANFNIFIEKSWRVALKDASTARELHEKAIQQDKTLVDALLIPSTHDFVVGSLPWYARAIGFLAGFRGDKEAGIKGIHRVANEGRRTQVEAKLLLAMVHRRQGEPAKAAEIMDGLVRQFPKNYLYRMEKANALADARQRDAARREAQALATYANLEPGKRAAFVGNLEQRLK